ncbi:MAG: response regulator [Bacteroidia bacterium]
MLHTKIKILIADPHPLVRNGIKFQLSGIKHNVSVIGEVSNGRELLDSLKICVPDIVIFDTNLPVVNGFQILEIIKNKYAELKSLVTSFKDDYLTIGEIYSKGANGFISKNSPDCCVLQAIKQIQKTGKYFNDQNSESLLRGYLKATQSSPNLDNITFSQRESEIMKELCDGHTNSEIAQKLHISSSTVDFHKKNIYRKTGSKKMVDLMKYAVKNQLVLLD